jgi:undecaprenyl-diphosphatase
MIKPIRRRVKKGYNKIAATIALLSLEIVVVLVAFLAALAVFIFIADMIFLKKRNGFDVAVSNFLSAYVSPAMTDVMQFFSFLGTHYFLIPANLALVCYFAFIKKHRWYSIKVPVVAVSGVLLMFILKFIFNRERPLTPLLEPARGLSFPSGHALMSFTFYGLIIYLVWNSIGHRLLRSILITGLLILIFFIGLSRIYLVVHYASDVLAGFSLGLIWLVLCISLLDKMEQYSRRNIPVVQPAEVPATPDEPALDK